MNWKKIIGWSLVAVVATYAASLLSGVIAGVAIWHSDTDPETIDQIVRISRITRRSAVAIALVVCYWRLGAGASQSRFAHIVAAFLLILAADLVISLLLGAELAAVMQPRGHLWALLYALVGYVLARLRPNNSFKPKPLRGSA